MIKKLFLIIGFLFLWVNQVSALSVIQGMNPNLFGMSTTAGSGATRGDSSTICRVVNLNFVGTGVDTDAGDGIVSGDLKYCLDYTGPKTIIFDVSGLITIPTTGTYWMNVGPNSYTTIAGQTAPSPGVTIQGNITINRNTHDVLIQHIRFRTNDADLNGLEPDYADNITMDAHYRVCADCTGTDTPLSGCTGIGTCNWGADDWTPSYNIVIDHCSFSWAIDENLEAGGNNVTISNSIISEGLNNNSNPKGSHSKGSHFDANNDGVTGNQSVAVVNNLYAHNADRNPSLESGYMVIINNVMYDYQFGMNIDDDSTEPVKVSIAGNYLVDTDLVSYCIYLKLGVNANSMAYFAPDNYFDGGIQADPWNLNEATSCFEQRITSSETASDVPEANRTTTASDAVWPSGYTAMTAANARTYVLQNAGAFPGSRDAVDARIVAEVTAASGTSKLIDVVGYANTDCTDVDVPIGCCTGAGTGTCVQNDEAGYPAVAANTRTLTLPANPNTVAVNGYTNLENWLDDYNDAVSARPKTTDMDLTGTALSIDLTGSGVDLVVK